MAPNDKSQVESMLESLPHMPNMKQDDRNMNPYIVSDNSRPENWYPDNAMDRLVHAEDLAVEYELIVREYIAKYRRYANAQTSTLDEPLDTPEWIGDNEHVASEMLALSNRLIKGTMGEHAGARYVREAKGFTVMSTDSSERLGKFTGDIDEDHGIDFIAVTPTGRLISYQVKTSTSAAKNYSGDADRMLIVDMNSGKVREKVV